jgi:hypothetical protein
MSSIPADRCGIKWAPRLLQSSQPQDEACQPPNQSNLKLSACWEAKSFARVYNLLNDRFLPIKGKILLSLLIGVAVVVIHASFRVPNLKTRLASAREDFRAVW